MIVKNTTNKLSALPKSLHKYALTQNNDGILDVSVGKYYAVFATREDEYGKWYFVHTDTENEDGMWWMPATLYEVVDDTHPKDWVKKTMDTETYEAYPSLYDWEVSNGIEDGNPDAIYKYVSEVRADPTFPSEEAVEKLNQSFHKEQKQKQYETDLRLARERGWDWPAKPE